MILPRSEARQSHAPHILLMVIAGGKGATDIGIPDSLFLPLNQRTNVVFSHSVQASINKSSMGNRPAHSTSHVDSTRVFSSTQAQGTPDRAWERDPRRNRCGY